MTRSRKRKLARNRAKWASMPLASAILASGGMAHAAADTDQGTLEEVVVTAQKRSEDLQKVPISLQVLSTEKLEQLQVTQFDDYAKFLPSVSFKSLGPSQAELFFRGIASGGGTLHAGFLPSSGLYLDDIPVTTVAGSLDLHVYDIARVEALAGPQGTLYGASSLSGTLRIITNKPDPTAFSAAYDVKADKWGRGNGGGGFEGYVNIPLSEHAAIRLVGYYDHDGGYINNVYRQDTYQRFSPGGTPVASAIPDGHPNFAPITVNNANVQKGHYNDIDSVGGRAALKVDLNDQWSITPAVIAQHQRTHGDFGFDPKFGDLNVADYFLPRNLDRWYQSELTVEGKISNWDLVYSGGWFERKVDNLVDYSQYTVAYDALAISGGPFSPYAYTRFADTAGNLIDPTQYTANKDKYTKMSHELRLSSPAENRFRATTGLFYQRQTDDIRAEFDVKNLPVYYEVTGQKNVLYLSQQDRTDRDYAVFGEGTFDVTDKLKLTGGIREFWVNNTLYGFFGFNDNVTNYGYSSSGEAGCFTPIVTTPGVYTGGNRPCVNTDKKVVEHGETHKINLTYQLTPDVMLYGTWSTGFRPGGNNRKPSAGSFKSDTLANFELGWKTAWFDRRLRANGAVFYEKWRGVQTSVQGANGITSIVNAGDARVEGLESDVSWAVDEHLTLTASATGLLKAEITSTFCAPTKAGQVQFGCTTPVTIDATAGTQLPVTPKVKGNGTARYAFNVGDYKSFLQGSVIHQSATTYSLENTRFFAGDTPSFTTFDFSAGTGKDNWHVEAFIENAFDKRGQLGKLSECNDAIHYCLSNAKIYPIRPMQFGVKFGQKF